MVPDATAFSRQAPTPGLATSPAHPSRQRALWVAPKEAARRHAPLSRSATSIAVVSKQASARRAVALGPYAVWIAPTRVIARFRVAEATAPYLAAWAHVLCSARGIIPLVSSRTAQGGAAPSTRAAPEVPATSTPVEAPARLRATVPPPPVAYRNARAGTVASPSADRAPRATSIVVEGAARSFATAPRHRVAWARALSRAATSRNAGPAPLVRSVPARARDVASNIARVAQPARSRPAPAEGATCSVPRGLPVSSTIVPLADATSDAKSARLAPSRSVPPGLAMHTRATKAPNLAPLAIFDQGTSGVLTSLRDQPR